MSNQKTKSTGIGFFGVVFIVFLVLKLTGIGAVAGWSWWWVTCPLWFIPATWITIIVCFTILSLIYGIVIERK